MIGSGFPSDILLKFLFLIGRLLGQNNIFALPLKWLPPWEGAGQFFIVLFLLFILPCIHVPSNLLGLQKSIRIITFWTIYNTLQICVTEASWLAIEKEWDFGWFIEIIVSSFYLSSHNMRSRISLGENSTFESFWYKKWRLG